MACHRYIDKESARTLVCWAAIVLCCVCTTRAEEGFFKPADTSSPRATLKSFIDSCNGLNRFIHAKRYVDRSSPEIRAMGRRALDCVDASLLPEYAREERAGEVAICLKEILDRIELPPYDEIPGTEAVEAAGGGKTLQRWRIPGTRITIGRVEEGPQRHEYLFTPGTVLHFRRKGTLIHVNPR